MTEPETMHLLTVLCGTIAIIVSGGVLVSFLDRQRKK